jgi:hypothetical protein
MSIAVSLDALLDTLTRVGAPLTAWLAPGIERPQIDARLGGFPARLADEVYDYFGYDYFGWRNGLSLSRDADYELFPGFTVLSLDEALADYRMQLDAANRIARRASIPALSLWNERWLPLFRDAGGDPHVTVAGVHPAPNGLDSDSRPCASRPRRSRARASGRGADHAARPARGAVARRGATRRGRLGSRDVGADPGRAR